MNLQDEDNSPSRDKPILDEDPNEEVAEEDVLAEVKLAATIRQSRCFLDFFFFTCLANPNRTQMVSSCCCNKP